MISRRDKETEELLDRIRAEQRPSTMVASFVGKLIFFPRGPIWRAVGTLLFSIMAGATVGSAALFVVSIGAIVAGIWLEPSEELLAISGGGGILLVV